MEKVSTVSYKYNRFLRWLYFGGCLGLCLTKSLVRTSCCFRCLRAGAQWGASFLKAGLTLGHFRSRPLVLCSDRSIVGHSGDVTTPLPTRKPGFFDLVLWFLSGLLVSCKKLPYPEPAPPFFFFKLFKFADIHRSREQSVLCLQGH